MVLLESDNSLNTFFDFVFNLITVKLDYSLGSVQEASVIFKLVDEQSQFCDDIIDSVCFHNQLRLLRGQFGHFFLDKLFQV